MSIRLIDRIDGVARRSSPIGHVDQRRFQLFQREKMFDQAHVARRHGPMERRSTGVILLQRIGAMSQQELDDLKEFRSIEPETNRRLVSLRRDPRTLRNATDWINTRWSH